MDIGCAVLLLDSEKAEEVYAYVYPTKERENEVTIGKDVHSSALLLLGMKDLIFQITGNEGLRALYTKASPNFVLVLLHSPGPTFQFLLPSFARDLARWAEFQIGPDWAARVAANSKSSSLHRELDAIFAAGLARFGAQGTDYAWVELVGGGVCEGVVVGEASEAQLCEAVATMEVGCTTKQHLVCVDIDGISVVGTCIFAGTKLIYTTLNSNLARQVWEWLAVQQAIPNYHSLLQPPSTSSSTPPHLSSHPHPPPTRKSTHGEWQKIAQVFPSSDYVTPNPRYAHTYALAALAQEEFVVCVLIQAGGPNGGPKSGPSGWIGNDLRGAIVIDETRGLLHSLRAAGTLTRIRKQLSANSPQLLPSSDLPYLVTPSPDITLFHFVAHNQITGVVMHHTAMHPSLPPPTTPPNTLTSPLEILFVKTCEKIRKLMISSGAHEHGVRVTLGGEDQYWIVGRSSIQGTFFVCYSSHTPQSVVEMAFKAQFFSNQYI